MSFFSGLGKLFRSALDAAGRFFSSLFQSEVQIVDNVQHIVAKFEETKLAIEHELDLVRHFQFDPHWKSRVINVPIAVKQMQDLISMVTDIFKGKLEKVLAPIHDLSLVFKTEAAPDPLGDKPAAISKAAIKVDEIAAMIKQTADAMDVISEVAHDFETITAFLQNLDQVFLSQKARQVKRTLTVRKRQRL